MTTEERAERERNLVKMMRDDVELMEKGIASCGRVSDKRSLTLPAEIIICYTEEEAKATCAGLNKAFGGYYFETRGTQIIVKKVYPESIKIRFEFIRDACNWATGFMAAREKYNTGVFQGVDE